MSEDKVKKCRYWALVPVFGFFSLILMAEYSGKKEYRKQGVLFGTITVLLVLLWASSDLILFFLMRRPRISGVAIATIRSLLYSIRFTLPLSYLILMIHVFRQREERVSPPAVSQGPAVPQIPAAPARTEKIDLNHCSAEEMMELPGIDAAVALQAVKDREASGGFASAEDFLDQYHTRIKPHFAARLPGLAFAERAETSHPVTKAGKHRVIDL